MGNLFTFHFQKEEKYKNSNIITFYWSQACPEWIKVVTKSVNFAVLFDSLLILEVFFYIREQRSRKLETTFGAHHLIFWCFLDFTCNHRFLEILLFTDFAFFLANNSFPFFERFVFVNFSNFDFKRNQLLRKFLHISFQFLCLFQNLSILAKWSEDVLGSR